MLAILANFGLPGVVIGLLFLWIWRLDSRYDKLSDKLRAEQTARVDDAKKYTEMALKLQGRVIDAVATISRVFETDDPPDAGGEGVPDA